VHCIQTCTQKPERPLCLLHLQLPSDVTLKFFDAEGNMQEITTGDLTKGKKVGGRVRRRVAMDRAISLHCAFGCLNLPICHRAVHLSLILDAISHTCSHSPFPCVLPGVFSQVVLFAVPGAFTPTCSLKHLPGFIEKADELKAKGVDTIACVAVNDAFVMDAWGKSVNADGKVTMLADGSAVFAKVRRCSAM
jgi:hypothetical protein